VGYRRGHEAEANAGGGGGLHERQALDQPYDARETNRLQKRIQELGDGREDRVAYRRRKRRRQTKDEAGARLPKFALFRPCDAQQNTISQRKWGREVGEGGKLPILPVGRKKWTAIGGGVTGAAGAAAERGGAADNGGRHGNTHTFQLAWRNTHELSENERGKGMEGGRISYCGQEDGNIRWLGRR
jgi:hypothetical protein